MIRRIYEMNKRLVAYCSRYGGAKQYAEWIAEALDAETCEIRRATPDLLETCAGVVYGGGVYASRIEGLKRFLNKLPSGKLLAVFAVGLSEPGEETVRRYREANLPNMLREIPFYYFQGAFCYEKLTLPHKLMIGMMKKIMQKENPEQAELLQDGDWRTKEAIEPLVDEIISL
jgi:menaquinone-dependent protoporphyrinogen IX oxidase